LRDCLRQQKSRSRRQVSDGSFFHAIQHTDLRCPPEKPSAEDAAALKDLGPIIEQIKNEAAANKK
jgi:hypothetical protein